MLDLPPEYQQWARSLHLEVAPGAESRLCPSGESPEGGPRVSIVTPRARLRLLRDPETPAALSTLRLAARVEPAEEEIVWLVDGAPLARVAFPHEARWPIQSGTHVFRAVGARGGTSAPVTVVVE